MNARMQRLAARLRGTWDDLADDERGDVPGWVLITVMTAGLVAIIYGVAKGELRELVRDALRKVS